MVCKVGITTDPGKREAHWRKRHPNLRWEILGKFSTKKDAQRTEAFHAAIHNCEAHAGGPDKDGPWHVYKFDYSELGQFFTPDWIVERMLALRQNHGRALEPSAGDGAFLSRLESGAVGVEIDGELRWDPRLVTADFFGYPVDQKFETIIGNPPYVRYQDIPENTKRLLPMDMFDRRSNLYLFFIAKCMEHLTEGGELIFITPRDFLKTTSSRKLNAALYERGSMTHYYELGDMKIFDDASPNCAIWRWVKGRRSRRMATGGMFQHRDGQIWFGPGESQTKLGDFFDIKVGAVSGADDVFHNERCGQIQMVCSYTATTKETKRVIYNEKHRSLHKHKDRLILRKIRRFDDSNWWEWGRKFCHRTGPRIYVNAKTRNPKPFYVSEVEAYDGSVLALFPKERVNISKAAQILNKVNWDKLGFVCDGRLMLTQRSLSNAPIDIL